MKISGSFVSKNTASYMRQLYPPGEADKRIRILGIVKARLFFSVISVSLLIFIPVFVIDQRTLAGPVNAIERNGYGEGARYETLKVTTDDGYEDKVSIEVNERRYSDEELLEFSERFDEYILPEILGANTEAENVTSDLVLGDKLQGFPFDITWKSDRPLYIDSKGVINTERLTEDDPEDKGIPVQLCASLKYRDHTEDKYFNVVLHRRRETLREKEADDINGSIKTSDELSETKSIQELPKTAGGRRISFYRTAVNRGWVILLLGVATAFLLISSKDAGIKKEAGKRRDQIEADHPVILNQYMLYFMAGMNPRAIWNCICRKYEESLKEKGALRRYAYEEMLSAKNRMDEGCSELEAYDEFALRCDNIRFRTFVSLVKQAVVKGNDGLGDILYDEVDKAQRKRNNRVKMKASEAETKLLLPMFMMLMVVLAIVMIPAFIGLNE